ncbi:MAG: hypothetical protein HYW01_10875 [Deltaproteobacteria bacterium]|nr:hypothetical protein [Deltaproteobacteria bacterium]
MRNRVLFSLLPIFVLLLLIASCGKSDKKEIEELLSRRQKAFEAKDIDLYLSCISPDYKEEKGDKVIGIEDLKKDFLSNVSIFDQIKISYSDRSMYQQGEKAEVVQKTAVEVKIENDQSRFQINEKIGFEKIRGKWEIVKESDADFLKGFVFGGKI